MEIEELKESISGQLDRITQQTFPLDSPELDREQSTQLIEQYVDIFKAIWGDANSDKKGYIHKLDAHFSKSEADFYLT